MGRRALALVALLLLIPALAPAPALACAVPCGRIYPLILIQLDDQATTWNLTRSAPVEVDATLTYKFDMVNEGYTVASPNEPVEIRFEFPRKPGWAEIKVDPEVIPVDVNNPTYAQPDLADPTNPQGSFVFTAPIKITLTLTGQPILKDGYDHAKLLVFAKSSESGLYQSGYGIKELRVVPEGALHESDVAGERDTFVARALPPIYLAPMEAGFGGVDVRVEPPASARFWEPAEMRALVSPAPAGRMVFAVHDERGALVASTPPQDAAAGEARLNVTFAQPGRHTATFTLLPEPGTAAPPLTYALPFDVGTLEAEGFAYPKTYFVQSTERVPAPAGSTDDALAQFERDVPFFVFDTAQSVSATLTLVSGAPVDLGRSAANLQFSIHDPDGNVLQAGSVDPTKPTWSLRVGSVPTEGFYVVRIKGVGAPIATPYDVRIEANYASSHETRNLADGAPDITGGISSRAGANLTLPVAMLDVWTPGDITPARDAPESGLAYTLTIYDDNGTLAYASGIREGAASFSAPAPGTYRAYVYAEPTRGSAPFSPIVRAFTFDVGRGETTIATTFRIEDMWEAAVSATPSLLGYHAVRVLEGASAPVITGGALVDAEGAPAQGSEPGLYFLRVSGQGAPPAGSAVSATLEQSYASAVSLVGPGTAEGPQGKGLPVPGLAIALVLAAVGALAVALALARR